MKLKLALKLAKWQACEVSQFAPAGDIILCLFETNTAAQTGQVQPHLCLVFVQPAVLCPECDKNVGGSLLQTNTDGNLANSTFNSSKAGQLGCIKLSLRYLLS